MGLLSVLLICLSIGVAVSDEITNSHSVEDLVPVTIFISAEQYQACKEYGHCTFTPQSVSLNEPDVADKLDGKSYFELCRKIHLKMEKMESEHPEVKELKLKLMQMLDAFSSDFELESKKGELIAMKLLDLVQKFIDKLKVEFKDKLHKPEPVFTIEPTTEEVTAEPEPDHPIFVGSIKGVPGIDFPDYKEIPMTSFTCSDKKLIPGFYADLETGCQVFHLCYEHRRESFLCPVGTIFNQPILACDYWYSANCSLAPNYYEKPNIPEPKIIPTIITTVTEEKFVGKFPKHPKKEIGMEDILKFIPVKAKVTDIPEFGKPIKTPKLKSSVTLKDTEVIADKIFDGILSLGSKVISKASGMLKEMPDPQEKVILMPSPLEGKLSAKAFSTLGKAKVISSAAKLSAAGKLASAAAFTSGKAKMASFAAIPIMKSKVASAAALPLMKTKVAVPIFKAKAASVAIPIVKGKLFTLPLAKTKIAAAAIPAYTVKKAAKAVPFMKVAALKPKLVMAPLKVKSALVLPIMKTKLAKAAVSPLTKKALALGYLKLLKAKKLALMG